MSVKMNLMNTFVMETQNNNFLKVNFVVNNNKLKNTFFNNLLSKYLHKT